jgi:hypothetical protein
VKICPHWTVNGLRKMIPSEQVEAWLTLSESRLTLACLLKFVLTCEPTQGIEKMRLEQNQGKTDYSTSKLCIITRLATDNLDKQSIYLKSME